MTDESQSTHVVRNMGHGSLDPLTIWSSTRDDIGKVPLVDLDVDSECRAEGRDLHVVSISASLGHALEMALKHTINVGFCWRGDIYWSRVGGDILPLRISSHTTTRVDVYEHLVVVGMFSHIIYYFRANDVVIILVTVQLIGKSIEQTVA